MEDWDGPARPLELSEPQVAAAEAVLDRPLVGEWARTREWLASNAALVWFVAAAAASIHFLTASRYGYFRDELYYAACGQHLAWGYVDQAPLIAVISWFTRRLLGDSLLSLRFFPALSAAAKVPLTAWFVRELHGRRFAYALAAAAVLFCPIYLTLDSFLSMNSFEPLFWMSCAAIAMRIARGASPRWWLLFGAIAGFGLLNKHSTLFFGAALAAGLLLSGGTRWFRNAWIWLGALISFLIFLPNLIWEIAHHFPTIEILRNVANTKNAVVPWYDFIAEQGLLVHPLATPVCLAGLWFFFADRKGRAYRFLGWTYVLLLLEMLALKGRIYYMAPIYPMLFAAGAVWIEAQIERRGWRLAKRAILVPLAIGGIVAAPLALPILPVDAAAAYSNFWDIHKVRVENYDSGRLPQLFADMFGWQNQAAVVASVYASLTPADRERSAILAGNYGEAGAIDYFGPKYGLPRAISPHNNYYLWGPRENSGELVIAFGMPLRDLQGLFEDVQEAATITDPYAIPDESDLRVYICRRPRLPLSQAWPKLKFFG